VENRIQYCHGPYLVELTNALLRKRK